MKYKLLKDMPTIKAGTIFKEVASDFNQWKELVRITPIGAKTSPQFTIQDIDNFDEWFEEIKEPTDSIHYKPKDGDEYFYVSDYGNVYSDIWRGEHVDNERLALGFIYPTEEECEKAKERRLAEVRLQRTSNFKPDFENCNGGWAVYYDHGHETLALCELDDCDAGEPVRYATKEEAEKSIRENERDWKIFFGIKEEA
jgi:hypothetical protein